MRWEGHSPALRLQLQLPGEDLFLHNPHTPVKNKIQMVSNIQKFLKVYEFEHISYLLGLLFIITLILILIFILPALIVTDLELILQEVTYP